MKKGLILIHAYTTLEHSLNQSRRLKEEFEKLDVSMDILRNDSFYATINSKGTIDCSLLSYDFCVYLDKDKYISFLLEKEGMKLFNSHFAIRACDDKMITSILLANQNIPMPKTLPGLLCYNQETPIKEETYQHIEKELSYPLILKTSYGSLGNGVYKVENRKQLMTLMEQVKCKPHLFQEFISFSQGRDIRVIVIGNKVIASMIRESKKDFRSNLELGGKGIPFTPSKELTDLCEKVSRILHLDYCGIDVLFEKDGYKICEVNSNAFFGGIEKVTGKNIAKAYAEYIYQKIYSVSS